MDKELMRESKPLDKTKFTKVRNCFVHNDRVFLFKGDTLQIIDYDNLSEEQSQPWEIEINLHN